MQALHCVFPTHLVLLGILVASYCIVFVSGLQPKQRGAFATANEDDNPYGHPGEFDMYVFALTWAPEFCCENPDSKECGRNGNLEDTGKSHHEPPTPAPNFWGATHLTLHGLWPQYNYSRDGHYWPQYCSDAPLKEEVVQKFKPKWETYAPAYVLKEYLLPKHEWSRHGTCSGLAQLDYFMSSLLLITEQSTPSILINNIGQTITRSEIEQSYGGKDKVALACSDSGALQQAITCYKKDKMGRLVNGQPVTCPQDVLMSKSDNSCGDSIYIRRVGDC